MRKRILSLVLCLAVVFSGTTLVFAVEQRPEEPGKIMQTTNSESERLLAEKTESNEAQRLETTEPEPIVKEESDNAEQVKNVQTEAEVYVNPLYADVQSEADLKKREDGTSALAEEEYTSDESVLAANIRSGMENREETITLYYASEQEYDSTLLKKWVKLAFEETDVPTQGDYIRWVWGGYKASISYYQSNGTYYYTYTMTVTYYTTAEQETQVTEKIDELLNGFGFTSATPDYTKIKTIYDYICENVTYDHENLENEDYKLKYTAYAALINGTAVCQGYAVLLYRMLEEVDVDTRVISGTGNGGAHGWNNTQLRGKYYDLDSTWDAGRSSYSYFLKCDANFSGHARGDDYSSEEFYEAYPMDTADYVVQDGDLPAEANIIANGTCGENLTWTLDDQGTLTISGTGEMEDYSDYNSLPWRNAIDQIRTVIIQDGVTYIGYNSFRYGKNLTKVTIPDSVTSIGDDAFSECESLTGVTIPDGVTSIGSSAFSYCSNLRSIRIPDGVTRIESWTFQGCSNLASVTIPDGVTSISKNAFQDCISLTEVSIPASVTYIGEAAFSGCIGLTNITIPESVTYIYPSAFSNCTNMTNINVDEKNMDYASDDGILLNKDQTEISCYPAGKSGEYIIPGHITDIDSYAFSGCSKLTGITIPDSVTNIGYHAFSGCSSLPSVTLPNGITNIGQDVFEECSSLTSVMIPDSITEIEYGAFSGCSSLESVNIPSSVEKIGEFVFSGCTALSGINVDENNATYCSNNGALFTKDLTQIVCCPMGKFGAFTIPNGVTSIGESAFSGCSALTGIEIPDSVTSIGTGAFSGCSALENITIPDGVEKINTITFAECRSLTSVTIPSSVTSLGDRVFKSCDNLEEIYFRGDIPSFTEYDPAYICEGTFAGLTAVAYYPSTWTTVPGANDYGGTMTWVPYEVEPSLEITAQPSDYTGAVGDTATFTIEATGEGLTYQWQYQNTNTTSWNDSSQPGNQTDILSVRIEEHRNGQKYRCVITDADGNTVTSDAATLIVKQSLKITSQPSNYTGEVGDTAKFTVKAEGAGLTYQWQYQNVGMTNWGNSSQSGNQTDTLSVKIEEHRDGQKYRCVITDADGDTVISDAATLMIGQAETGIKIISQPSNYTGEIGDTAKFTVKAEGTGLTYQWQYQNVGMTNWSNSSQSGNKTDTISVRIEEHRDRQKYRCIITDADGNTVTSDAATLMIGKTETGIRITSQPSNYTGEVGTTAQFMVKAEGNGLTYQWQYQNMGMTNWGNSSQTGNQTDTLSVRIEEHRNGQKYRCVITDAEGNTVTSDAATLMIGQAATGIEIISQPSDYTGAAGDTAKFTVVAEGTGLTYQWQYQNVNMTNWSNSSQSGNKTNMLSVPITTARNGQKYRCVITDANGNSVASSAASIIVN